MEIKELLKANEEIGRKLDYMPMEYYPRKREQLLVNAHYMGYEFYVVNFGTHPCAYIRIPGAHKCYGVDYTQIDLPVNGGLTFSGNELYINGNTEKGWFVGWDYAHYQDYSILLNTGKKWTTEEIMQEVIDAIEVLSEMHEGND